MNPDQRSNRVNQLLDSLCDLAAMYRHYQSLGDIEQRDSTISDYLNVMSELQALGWNGSLDFECELPYTYMPASYLKDIPFES